jgi:hypothetical protein
MPENNYIFPSPMTKVMSSTSPKVQYEASMMGTALLLVSILLTTIYYVFFADNTWLIKGFIIFNAIAGFLMLGSALVTTYQQYLQYMQAVQLIKATTGEDISVVPASPKKIKRIRIISAVIEILIISSLSWLFNLYWLLILLAHPIYLLVTTKKFINKLENNK